MATILIVDDDADTRELADRYLRAVGGHRTLAAADGAEALEVVGREPVDLVVLDLVMPRMNGVAFLAALRADRPGLPVFVCSAMGRHFLDAEPALAGATGVLHKDDGFFLDLVDVVGRHLGGAGPGPAAAALAAPS